MEEISLPEETLSVASSEMIAFGVSKTNTSADGTTLPSYRDTKLNIDSSTDAPQFTASSDSKGCQSDSSIDIEAQRCRSTTPSLSPKFSVNSLLSAPRPCFCRDTPSTLFDVALVPSYRPRSASVFSSITASHIVDEKRPKVVFLPPMYV